jgi:signal transduction histidine kinase
MSIHLATSIIGLISYLALTFITVERGLRIRVNRFFSLYLLTMVLWQVASLMVSLSSGPAQARFWYRFMIASVAAQSLVYLLFTRAFLRRSQRRSVAFVGGIYLVATFVTVAIDIPAFIQRVHWDETASLFVPHFGPLLPVIGGPAYALLGYAGFLLLRAYTRTRTELEQNRISYLLLGLTLVVAGTVANLNPAWRAYPIELLTNIANAFLIAYAIFRYQLLDIAGVIRKGLPYSLSTAAIGTLYFLFVFVAERLLRVVVGYPFFLLSLVVAAVAAVAARPLQEQAQLWVDRWFFREKYDAQQMLQELSRLAVSILDIDTLTSLLLDRLTSTMHVEEAYVVLRRAESGDYWLAARKGPASLAEGPVLQADNPIAEWMVHHREPLTRHDLDVAPEFRGLWVQEREILDRLGAELLVPLLVRGELIGMLILGRKRSGSPYSSDEQLTLTTLANQTAVAVQNAWLYRKVQNHAQTLEKRVHERTAALEAQYARLEAILETTADGIVVTDSRGSILQANPIACHWLTQGLLTEDARRLRQRVRCLARRSKEHPEEVLELNQLDLELTAAPIDETGKNGAAVVAVRDVSHLKALARMKARFVSNVSHELRTPVACIKAFVDLMQREPERWQEYLEPLAQEADHQVQLVEDILEISRADAGRVDVVPEPTSLSELAREEVTAHRTLAAEQDVTLTHHPADSEVIALVDPQRMKQVLDNLISNAIRYTPDGGKVTVSTGEEKTADEAWATMTVSDDGIGIPEEELDHIFDRFFRGEQPRSMQIPGTGLGLAIVKEIVELHEGQITVRSKPQQGSSFTVWLPVVGRNGSKAS